MYQPSAFREDDIDRLHGWIAANAFGTLVAATDGGLEAVHAPFLLDRDPKPHGMLRAHVARANPIWRAFDGTKEALAIFQGPHAYISPDWYAEANLVPTWNYVAVHAYGAPRLLEDTARDRLLEDLVAVHETALAPKCPWTVERVAPSVREGLARAVVAFALPIARLEGKAKLSQNRTPGDIARAARFLDAHPGVEDRAIGALMQDIAAKPAGGSS